MAFQAKVAPENFHTAILVKDLEAQVAFFRDVVGLPVLRYGGDPNRPVSAWLPALQLMRAEDKDISVKGVFDHVGIAVTNIEEIMASLAANNVRIDTPLTDRSTPAQRLRLAFFFDPEGNKIELTDRVS